MNPFEADERFRLALADEGSPLWAERCKRQMQEALSKVDTTLIVFRGEWQRFFEKKGWELLTDENNKPFVDYRAFALSVRPFGLGMDKIDFVRHCEAVESQLGIDVSDRCTKLDGKTINAGNNPNPNRSGDIVTSNPTGKGNSADYLTARIKRDHPEVFERMKAGEFTSVRQAALAAKIVKPTFTCPIDPERAANLILKHFELKNVKTLIQLLNSGISNRKT